MFNSPVKNNKSTITTLIFMTILLSYDFSYSLSYVSIELLSKTLLVFERFKKHKY